MKPYDFEREARFGGDVFRVYATREPSVILAVCREAQAAEKIVNALNAAAAPPQEDDEAVQRYYGWATIQGLFA